MDIGDLEIWLINLPRDVERRTAMETQLAKMGLKWKLYDAVDGKAHKQELLKSADETAYRRNMGTSMLPGKLGVYASHLGVWQQVIASKHDIALILEDDVVFHDDFLEALSEAIAGQDHWDLVRFNSVRAKLPVSQGKLGRYRLNAYVGPFTGNAAYLIKSDVAKRILPRLWPQTRALDHELNRFFLHDYRQRGLEPFASHPDDGDVSTITGVGSGQVRKFKWYQRMPYVFLKTANYFRRFFYLGRTATLIGRTAQLGQRRARAQDTRHRHVSATSRD